MYAIPEDAIMFVVRIPNRYPHFLEALNPRTPKESWGVRLAWLGSVWLAPPTGGSWIRLSKPKGIKAG